MYVNNQDLFFGQLGSFFGLGALVEHAEVGKLQRFLNVFAEAAGFAPLSIDNKYGGCTHAALKKAAKYAATMPTMTLPVVGTVLRPVPYPGDAGTDAIGPFFLSVFLLQALTQDEINKTEDAWKEWVAEGKPACGVRTDGTPPDVLPEPPGPPTPPTDGGIVGGDIVPQPKKAGLGTLGWVLIGLGVVAAGGVVYYVATQKPATGRA